jgi:hypothetical protein
MVSWGWLVAALAAGLLLREFLPSYVREKAKNLATKEDIQSITRLVEDIKTENQLVLERAKPLTAEETIRRESFVRAKLEAYYEAINVLAKVFASMQWNDSNAALRGPPTAPPTEWEMNVALAKLGMLADEPDVFDAFMEAVRGGNELMTNYRRFLELARKDMKFEGASLAPEKLKYVFGRGS